MDLNTARTNMIEQQIRPWNVLDQRVLDVLDDVPREQFVGPGQAALAYCDTPISLGHGQSMLPPVVAGRILQSVAAQADESVLLVGTGRGYLTACLSRLAKTVLSVDCIEAFTESAQGKLETLGIDPSACKV